MAGLSLALAVVVARPSAAQCAGDCNDDGAVPVNELVLAVSIALGNQIVSACPPADRNGDGLVTVNEVVTAVGSALCGCGQACSTPQPPATPTRSSTPTGTPALTRVPPPTATPRPRPPTPVPTPTRRPGTCVQVQQGTWCFEFGARGVVVLEAEGRLKQSKCTVTFDNELVGPLDGNDWSVSASSPEGDLDLSGSFFGNPAKSFEGGFNGIGEVSGRSGQCPDGE